MTDDRDKNLTNKLNMETALAPWRELQSFFAQGLVLHVSASLDLLHVAEQLSLDNDALFNQWLAQGVVGKVDDKVALDWFQNDATLWSVVIKPWILVQEQK